jgi:hypothetical protein
LADGPTPQLQLPRQPRRDSNQELRNRCYWSGPVKSLTRSPG